MFGWCSELTKGKDEKALDCRDAIDELRETESELYKQRFDNVVTEYDGILGLIEHEKNLLDEFISQSEAKAWLTSTKYYEALSKNERETIEELRNEKDALIESLGEALASGTIQEGSEAWVEMCTQINEVTEAIEESNTALLEYAQTIQELEWEQFDVLQERISRITEESEFLIELMSNKKLFDDKGQFTDEGMATMGLHGVNYNTNMHQADMYGAQAEIEKAKWEADPNDRDAEQRYYEMLELQREHILLAEDEKNAIKDLVEEGIDLELSSLEELIDKRNEALDNAKDLYDYNKKVAEQTKEIAALEKEMSAYSGDDSEETKSKIQEIKLSLEEAKADLEETEYEKMIDDAEVLLDDLYLDYETILNERLDNIDLLMSQMTDAINMNASTINDTLSTIAGDVGTELSTYMNTIWGSGTTNNVTDAITMYSNDFKNTMTSTLAAINGIKAYTDMLKKKLDDEAAAKAAAAAKAKEEAAAKAKAAAAKAAAAKTSNSSSSSGGDGVPKVGDKVKFLSGSYYYDSYGTKPSGSKHHGEYVYITHINKKGSKPYHISTGSKLGKGDLGWLTLSQISGYATGKKKLFDDEVAWTQEKGREMIVRPSDGAVLTPLAKGDSVLNAEASGNIWDMANSPADFIKENLNLGAVDANIGSGSQTNIEQNFDQIVFNMPNVKNYDEMLAQMKSDKNFQRLIDAMGVDQIAGKSSLRKGKAIR